MITHEQDYFRLVQALVTKSVFDQALEIAERHIDKENFHPHWRIIKIVCLQKIGKLGLAYNEIKASLDENRFSSEYLTQYVHIGIQFGLLAEVEEALIDLLAIHEERKMRLSFLSNLIHIYLTEKGFSDKLQKAVRRFGELVNREDCTEEGRFLNYFLMTPKNDKHEEVKEFQERLSNYVVKFPNSHILKQGTIALDSGPEALLSTINKMAGITEEQLTKWEQNKNKIRNGSLPVPFVMLERFLCNTNCLFTTWVLANNTPEDQLEFKLNQAPQLEQAKFDSILSENKSVLIEDSSLLILHEVGALDKFLGGIDELCLLESTFERISKNNYPLLAGSIYSYIPQQILHAINHHKAKLRLITNDGIAPFDVIQKELNHNRTLFLTDDVNLLRLVVKGEESLISANSYNIVEYLFNQSIITGEKKYSLISDICSLGIHQPNMTIRLLADALTFFTGVINDYTETGFRKIFDKVFSGQRNMADVLQLFFRTIFFASNKPNFHFKSEIMIPLFRGILIRHPCNSLDSFASFWFVFQCLNTTVSVESELMATSAKHVELWQVYNEIICKGQDNKVATYDLLLSVVNQIFYLNAKFRVVAYQNIKCCFTPLTKEAELFEQIYREVAIKYQLINLRS